MKCHIDTLAQYQVKTGSVCRAARGCCDLPFPAMASRGMNRLLPVLLLAAVAKFFTSTAQSGFVMSGSSSRTSKVQMRGFKDDFYAWKDTLSSEDQALLLKQAQNEFNKKFRASDEFKKSVPEDKIESFGKVLQKFFDNEREDYKKDWFGILMSFTVTPSHTNSQTIIFLAK